MVGRPALPWANFSTSPSSTTAGLNGLHHFASAGPSTAPMGLTSSQSLDLSPKTWTTAAAVIPGASNPFMQASARAFSILFYQWTFG